jgi:FKBP-type peptidyl-prolyl cis-trans isomerase (trigger factor)
MAGKEVRFDVTLVDIKEKVLPEVNDDFAKDLGRASKAWTI